MAAVLLTSTTGRAVADCVVVLTDHPDFDYDRVAGLASLVADARNATWGIAATKGRVVRL